MEGGHLGCMESIDDVRVKRRPSGEKKRKVGDLDDAEMRQSPNFVPSLRRDEFRQKLTAYYGNILKTDEYEYDDGVT